MSVITISRETGSGGHQIAERVAHTLDYRLVDKAIIGRVYSRYACDEFGLDVGYVPELWSRFDVPNHERRVLMVDLLNQVILALAHLDRMVIVGRSSFAVLAGFSDALNVRIQAPLATRIKRIAERRNIADTKQAEALVKQSDTLRAGFIEGFYGSQWDSARAFDFVIDTDKIALDMATRWLIQAAQALSADSHASIKTLKAIQVVPALASIVAEEIDKVTV